jgi:hypothetical protein
MLVEFPSVVDGVSCAVEIQRAMVDRNAKTAEDKRITFRIGVNLGDVIADGDDIYGDGVNIAARLEALAEPGGVCISRTVRDHIGDRLPYSFDDIGEQSTKNIAHPVQAYALRDFGGVVTGSRNPVAAHSAEPAQQRTACCPRGKHCRRDRHRGRNLVGLAEREFIGCIGSGIRSHDRATPACQ